MQQSAVDVVHVPVLPAAAVLVVLGHGHLQPQSLSLSRMICVASVLNIGRAQAWLLAAKAVHAGPHA